MSTEPDSSPAWLLKIFSGPHQGAEIEISTPTATIGSDSECDIVLHDVLVAAEHASLRFGKEGLKVTSLNGRTYCAGRKVVEPETPAKFYDFITVGGTHFVVGPSNESWPMLSFADIPDLEKDAEPVAEQVAEEKSDETASAEEPGKPKEAAPAVSTEELAHRKRKAYAGIAFGVALLVIWAFLWIAWGPRRLQEENRPKDPRVLAMEYLKSAGWSDRIRIEERQGRLSAIGYVDDDNELGEVQIKLREALPNVTPQLWSMERIAETANTFLGQWGAELTAKPDKLGRIEVTGKMKSRRDWSLTKARLLKEVPGLVAADEQIEFLEDGGKVAPTLVEESVTENFSVTEIRRRTDGMSWARLSNGLIVYPGGRIPGGKVESISESQVVILLDSGHRRALAPGEPLAHESATAPGR